VLNNSVNFKNRRSNSFSWLFFKNRESGLDGQYGCKDEGGYGRWTASFPSSSTFSTQMPDQHRFRDSFLKIIFKNYEF